jgi:hypothetical protein
MQYRYDAAVKMADIKVQANEDIKTLQKHIEFTKKQAYYSSTDIEKDEASIKAIQNSVKEAQAEFNANAPEISKEEENLYYAYKASVEGREVVGSADTYLRAFYEWAMSIGVKPTEETFKFITKAMGKKSLSAKAIVKNGGTAFNGALSPTAFFKLFYGEIMACLKAQNLLKGYTFTCDFANTLAKKAAEKKSK